MKKILYFLPACMIGMMILLIIAVLGSFEGLTPMAAIYFVLLLSAGVLLAKGHWWGALLGLPYGIIVMISDFVGQGRIVRQWPFGLLLCLYCMICGMICYFDQSNQK